MMHETPNTRTETTPYARVAANSTLGVLRSSSGGVQLELRPLPERVEAKRAHLGRHLRRVRPEAHER